MFIYRVFYITRQIKYVSNDIINWNFNFNFKYLFNNIRGKLLELFFQQIYGKKIILFLFFPWKCELS